ncbi:MAG: hypothetical protein LBD44_03575, partial [Spirochaetaceae bacterium]|nr:hypothetical protein [Spirochaetaceae bacterium]
EKGGWYSGNDRAVAKAYYVTSQYNNKVILDSYEAMHTLNARQTLASTGGTLIITGTVNEVKKTTLAAGLYRLEMRAGTGGWGGYGYDYSGRCAGATGEAKSESFILTDGSNDIYYAVGGDGNDGENAKDTNWRNCPGGGGGCSGGSSFIKIHDRVIICIGGSGGGGHYNGGGGGGGGFGIAEGFDVAFGMGGNNGVGGQGGSWHDWGTMDGGGGSGYLRGGAGGINASSGGSYGSSGGNGSTNPSNNDVKGGRGGASSTGETSDPADKNNTFKIQYQGVGGGGNPAVSGTGSAGGGGLKATSSGYVRIYRLA